MIDELRATPAGTPARADVEERVTMLAEAIQLASLCGLGQAAPLALLRALETFPDHFA
jgi:NADH:ubiquinone oxidoreductase subunit F (NADH-binding)